MSFVGSTPVAQYIYGRGSANGKRVQALGGAKNHMIVMPDADMDQAVDALMGAGYGSAGERCMAISVAVPVGEKTADRLVEALAPRVANLKVGPATDAGIRNGPRGHGRCEAAHHVAHRQGRRGRREARRGRPRPEAAGIRERLLPRRHAVRPRHARHVDLSRGDLRAGAFGRSRAEYDEAADLINTHEYGNGTAIFTRDGDTARAFADRIEVGMVGINVPLPVPVAYHSFGGWKRSMFGDHAIYGPEGVHFYTRLKTVTSRWPAGIRKGAEFNFPSLK